MKNVVNIISKIKFHDTKTRAHLRNKVYGIREFYNEKLYIMA